MPDYIWRALSRQTSIESVSAYVNLHLSWKTLNMMQLKSSGISPLDDRHWERKRSAEWDEPLPYFMQVGFELEGVEECVHRHFQNLLESEGMDGASTKIPDLSLGRLVFPVEGVERLRIVRTWPRTMGVLPKRPKMKVSAQSLFWTQ